MKYMILIYSDEDAWGRATPEQWQAMMTGHREFQGKVAGMGGILLGGEALESQQTATSIRGDVVTDGPFVESKEALGGFYLIDAPDLATAQAIARAVPTNVCVELRPVWDTTGMV